MIRPPWDPRSAAWLARRLPLVLLAIWCAVLLLFEVLRAISP